MTDGAATSGLNTDVPHSARVWNYLLGGQDHFAVDRAAADHAVKLMPELVLSARANRQFLGRAVRFLAVEGGIRQFLDVGTGLPTADNTHEVAQAAAAATLDLTQPTAIILSGIINFVMDDAEAHAVVGRLLGSVPSGSHLLISHPIEPGVVTCTAWRPDPRRPEIAEVVSEFVAVGSKR